MATDNVFEINLATGAAGERAMTAGELADRAARLAAAVARKATEDEAEALLSLSKADAETLLGKIDTALTDIATKQVTFQTTPNLTNAAPLLIELSQDMAGVLKALRYLVKRLS